MFVGVSVGGCVVVGSEVGVLVALLVIVGRMGEAVAVVETAVAETVGSVIICAGVIGAAHAVSNNIVSSNEAEISPENNLL